MYVDDMLAKNIITSDQKPTFDDLRKLVDTDPNSFQQLKTAIEETDNWVAPTLAKAGINSAGSFAGSAALVAGGTAVIVATGGTATPLVVGALSIAGAIGGSTAAGMATHDFFVNENGFNEIQNLEKKLQKGESVTSAEVFKVLVADDPDLQKAVKEQTDKRPATIGKKFGDLTEVQQQQVMDNIGDMSEACAVLAERANQREFKTKDLLTINNLALQNGGAEAAEILAGAKAVERNRPVLPSEAALQPVVANENNPPEAYNNIVPSTLVQSHSVDPEGQVVGNRDIGQNVHTAMLRNQQAPHEMHAGR
jgi:hypothetical protein